MSCQHEATLRDIMSTLLITFDKSMDALQEPEDVTDDDLNLIIFDLSKALLNCIAMIANSLAPERAAETGRMVAEAYDQYDQIERAMREVG